VKGGGGQTLLKKKNFSSLRDDVQGRKLEMRVPKIQQSRNQRAQTVWRTGEENKKNVSMKEICSSSQSWEGNFAVKLLNRDFERKESRREQEIDAHR